MVANKLSGKVAVITGGSSGIGLATARLFVDEGAFVFIMGRRANELERAAAAIGKNIKTVRGDVSNLDDLDRLFDEIKSARGSLDIVVANAGFVELVTLADATPEHFDKTFAVNARGTFFTVQKALPFLSAGASIVLVGSVASTVGIPSYTVYSATKAAIRSFSRSWAAELKDRGIRVNTLSPGPIDTPLIDGQNATQESTDAMKSGFAARVPLGRMGTAEEMARAVLFLASEDSSFSTGIDLVADGGLTQM